MLVGIAITYTVLGGGSLKAFANLVDPTMNVPLFAFIIMFGGVQLLLSLVRITLCICCSVILFSHDSCSGTSNSYAIPAAQM